MDKEQRNKIIESMIYEEAQRRRLLGDSVSIPSRKSRIIKIVGLAASIAILAFAGSQLFKTNTPDRSTLASEVYSFPTLDKSRSNSIIDRYIDQINQKQYLATLDSIRGKNLDDRSSYVAMHLYYAIDSLEQAQNLATNTPFQDDQYLEDAQWLHFLIEYRAGADKELLTSLSEDLEEKYKIKAIALIDKAAK